MLVRCRSCLLCLPGSRLRNAVQMILPTAIIQELEVAVSRSMRTEHQEELRLYPVALRQEELHLDGIREKLVELVATLVADCAKTQHASNASPGGVDE